DTTGPTVSAPDLAAAADSCSSDHDDLTNDTTYELRATVKFIRVIDRSEIKDGSTSLGYATLGAGGTWSFTPTTALADGVHNLTRSEARRVGNEGRSSGLPVTLDKRGPTVSAPDRAAESSNGRADRDDRT